MGMNRRALLGHTVCSLPIVLAGCAARSTASLPSEGGASRQLIDAHCHVFNASDLPAARFLRQVVFGDFPTQTSYRTRAIRDPDVADRFYLLMLRLLGADTAPSGEEEIAFLQARQRKRTSAESFTAAREAGIEDTAKFLISLDRRARRTTLLTMRNRTATEETIRRDGDRKFLDFFIGQKHEARRLDAAPLTAAEARLASRNAFFNRDLLSQYLNWFSLFRLYRHVLVDRLIDDTRRQGFDVLMLTPALVDFDEWLFEDVRTPLSKQMKVMSLIASRPNKPAMHGYIGFDPLREVAYREEIEDAKISSLETVRRALTEYGFAGVKLYPPMGFQASNNRGPYPKRTERRLGANLGLSLDKALDDLYALCVELDAPILAHAYNSNASGLGYDKRADPLYLIPVFEKYPALRVCLAHFGRFTARSAGHGNEDLPVASWEWVTGSFIAQHPDHSVFVDISYFSEVLNNKAEDRTNLAKLFNQWVTKFDPQVEHIVFDTDWIMLGKEEGYKHYIDSINSFLRSDCGFDDEACDRIFRTNAMRFLPLQQESVGRARLVEWYRRNQVDPKRLPVVPSSFGRNFLARIERLSR